MAQKQLGDLAALVLPALQRFPLYAGRVVQPRRGPCHRRGSRVRAIFKKQRRVHTERYRNRSIAATAGSETRQCATRMTTCRPAQRATPASGSRRSLSIASAARRRAPDGAASLAQHVQAMRPAYGSERRSTDGATRYLMLGT
jgi:hypothetical protein